MNKLNRRSFIKYFTGGLLGAGILPIVGSGETYKITNHEINLHEVSLIENPGFETKVGRDAFEEWTHGNATPEQLKEFRRININRYLNEFEQDNLA